MPDTPQHPPNLDLQDEIWYKTELRRAMHPWQPKSMAEARNFSMECVGRAEALAAVLVRYAWERQSKEWSIMRQCVELIDDLCHMAYGPMMDWWDDEEALQRHGWQPPTGEEPS